MPYLFQDTDIAATRLNVLAGVFAESTKSFVIETARCQPGFVVDLGCGPGYTTHALADIFQGSRVVGLENSEHFMVLVQPNSRNQAASMLVGRIDAPA